jgi:hypothetical protein
MSGSNFLATAMASLVAAAIYDATVAAWDSKYTYKRQHPSEIDSAVPTVVARSWRQCRPGNLRPRTAV